MDVARKALRRTKATIRHDILRTPRGPKAIMPPFTAHNIELAPGDETIAGQPLLHDQPLVAAMLRTLKLAFGDTPSRRIRVADLGCLEGGYTVELARAGYDAVGIEGRDSNYQRCRYVDHRLQLSNLHFIHDDVRNIDAHGPFDAIFCCGLLYHLDQPAAFLHQLGQVTRRLLLLHTHYAPPDGVDIPFSLSPLTTNEGRQGRWFAEFDVGTPEDEQSPWASVGNQRSFWLAKDHLLQAISDAGFTSLYEQYDFLAHQVDDPYIATNARSLFVGVKDT